MLCHAAGDVFETFDHTADLGLRVRAADLAELLAEAALGLFSIIVADLETIRPEREVEFTIAGAAPDYLLFDWLNELLYRFDAGRMLFSKFDVTLNADGLTARAWGEPLDESRHRLEHEVKAITYHGLKVEQQADGWLAELIVDI